MSSLSFSEKIPPQNIEMSTAAVLISTIKVNLIHFFISKFSGLDYVFATFCGIYLTSSVYFFIYTAFQKNRPKVYPRAILPGFVSGLMWGVATSSWFVANKVLSNAIAFPIVTTGPAVIASLLGVFAFHEIKVRQKEYFRMEDLT